MPLIAKVENASKVYGSGETEVVALQPATLEIQSGELLLIVGPSGSGKTTLLSLLGCVIYPTTGKVLIDGVNTSDLDDNELAYLRLKKLGFVFQNFNLIQPLDALQNVMLPLELQGKPKRRAKEEAENALAFVGLSHRKKSLPKQMSGGEQQRVAIARALVTEPMLMLCDEPTASLDSKSVDTVMKELRDLADKGRSLAVVTHDARLRDYAHRIVEVENGFVSMLFESMMKILIVIFMTNLALSSPELRAQTSSLGQFPTITASNLAYESFALPKDFQGELNIVLVAFTMEQQYDVDTWLPKVKEIVRENPSLRYYELPTIGGLWTLMRGQIDNWMRQGIPDTNARKATITLYTNTREFREPLFLPSEDRIYALLVDKSGKVWWKTDGRCDDEKLASLNKVVQAAGILRAK